MSTVKNETVVEKKYEILNDGEYYGGLGKNDLHRIRALKDFGNIKAGTLGGWVENEDNLSQNGTCWIEADAFVYDSAKVWGAAQIMTGSKVSDNAKVYGGAIVDGGRVANNAVVKGHATVSGWVVGNAQVCRHGSVVDDAYVEENALICGRALVGDRAQVGGRAIIQGHAILVDDVRVDDRAVIGGADVALISNNAYVCGNARIMSMNVYGNTIIGPNGKIDSQKDYVHIGNMIPGIDGITIYRTPKFNEFGMVFKLTETGNTIFMYQPEEFFKDRLAEHDGLAPLVKYVLEHNFNYKVEEA